MKVLLIEDDLLTGKMLSSMLTRYRYIVELATDGQQGFELAAQLNYDLILLDVRLPRLDGIHLCQRLRAEGCSTPILMLTACDSNEEIIQGLDAGADDYVIKPCEPEQLAARMRSLLRRKKTLSSPLLRWGDLTLNPDSAEVVYQDYAIHLSAKEYSLLELFLRHPHRVFSRNAIIDQIWQTDENPMEGTVTNLIKDLRRKLRAANITYEIIETLYGLGYRLKALPAAEKQLKTERAADCQKNELENRNNDQTRSELDTIAKRFHDTLGERISTLDRALQALQMQRLGPEQRQQAREEAHQLIGTLDFFGYGNGLEVMRAIEQVLQQTELQQTNSQPTEWSAAEAAHISQLRIALKQITASPENRLPVVPEEQSGTAARCAVAQKQSSTSAFSLTSSSASSILSLEWEPRKGSLVAGKIVAVDNDAIALETLKQILQPWGFQVIGFTDPMQFWQQFSTLQFDLALLDLEMPHLNGIELCQRIRQHPTQGDVPLLVVTAHTNETTIRQIFAAGADDFVSKPIVGPELVTRVNNHLQQRTKYPGQTNAARRRLTLPD